MDTTLYPRVPAAETPSGVAPPSAKAPFFWLLLQLCIGLEFGAAIAVIFTPNFIEMRYQRTKTGDTCSLWSSTGPKSGYQHSGLFFQHNICKDIDFCDINLYAIGSFVAFYGFATMIHLAINIYHFHGGSWLVPRVMRDEALLQFFRLFMGSLPTGIYWYIWSSQLTEFMTYQCVGYSFYIYVSALGLCAFGLLGLAVAAAIASHREKEEIRKNVTSVMAMNPRPADFRATFKARMSPAPMHTPSPPTMAPISYPLPSQFIPRSKTGELLK